MIDLPHRYDAKVIDVKMFDNSMKGRVEVDITFEVVGRLFTLTINEDT